MSTTNTGTALTLSYTSSLSSLSSFSTSSALYLMFLSEMMGLAYWRVSLNRNHVSRQLSATLHYLNFLDRDLAVMLWISLSLKLNLLLSIAGTF